MDLEAFLSDDSSSSLLGAYGLLTEAARFKKNNKKKRKSKSEGAVADGDV